MRWLLTLVLSAVLVRLATPATGQSVDLSQVTWRITFSNITNPNTLAPNLRQDLYTLCATSYTDWQSGWFTVTGTSDGSAAYVIINTGNDDESGVSSVPTPRDVYKSLVATCCGSTGCTGTSGDHCAVNTTFASTGFTVFRNISSFAVQCCNSQYSPTLAACTICTNSAPNFIVIIAVVLSVVFGLVLLSIFYYLYKKKMADRAARHAAGLKLNEKQLAMTMPTPGQSMRQIHATGAGSGPSPQHPPRHVKDKDKKHRRGKSERRKGSIALQPGAPISSIEEVAMTELPSAEGQGEGEGETLPGVLTSPLSNEESPQPSAPEMPVDEHNITVNDPEGLPRDSLSLASLPRSHAQSVDSLPASNGGESMSDLAALSPATLAKLRTITAASGASSDNSSPATASRRHHGHHSHKNSGHQSHSRKPSLLMTASQRQSMLSLNQSSNALPPIRHHRKSPTSSPAPVSRSMAIGGGVVPDAAPSAPGGTDDQSAQA